MVHATGAQRASVKLHATLVANVLRLPMSFFYVTPTGRLLARFSNDFNQVDQRLPINFRQIIPSTGRVRCSGTPLQQAIYIFLFFFSSLFVLFASFLALFCFVSYFFVITNALTYTTLDKITTDTGEGRKLHRFQFMCPISTT